MTVEHINCGPSDGNAVTQSQCVDVFGNCNPAAWVIADYRHERTASRRKHHVVVSDTLEGSVVFREVDVVSGPRKCKDAVADINHCNVLSQEIHPQYKSLAALKENDNCVAEG